MTLLVTLSPETEAWLDSEAKSRGTDPETIVRNIVEERSGTAGLPSSDKPKISERNKAAIAYFQERLAQFAAATPEEIRAAEEEYEELKRNLAFNKIHWG